jgi:hypothetical protein
MKRRRPVPSPFHNVVLTALALVGVSASTASAAPCTGTPAAGHIDATCQDAVGAPVCIHTPLSVPGLSGMPPWPATPGSTSDATARPEVTDPRWGNAPLRFMPNKALDDNARYRILVDDAANPTELAVSIQVKADFGSPGGADSYVFFGITDDVSTAPSGPAHSAAWGIQIPAIAVSNAFGNGNPVNPSFVNWYQYTSGAWSGGQGEWPTTTPWISSASTALWNTKDLKQLDNNGAAYAVQFKVNLAALGLNHANAKPLITLGVHNDFSDDGLANYADYYTPDESFCVAPCGTNLAAGPFHEYINEWTPVLPLGSGCTGVKVDGDNISTALGLLSGHAAVTVKANESNTFQVAPQNLNSIDHPSAGDVVAQFYMSNWGTRPTAAGWIKVPGKPGSLTTISAPIVSTCPNGSTDGKVCDTEIQTQCTTTNGVTTCNPKFHQCLQVQLSGGTSAGSRVSFENASAYTNTRFGVLSRYDEVAEINVKGLQTVLGNSNPRDVYLHVVTHNMPTASNTLMSMDVPALESMRSQVDPSFAQDKGYCANPTDLCGDGICIPTCARVPGCTQTYTYNGVCYCTSQGSGTCSIQGVAPAGGGYDPNTSSITRSDKLRAEYPTIEVFPYYDSGQTKIVRGQTRRRLVGMPSFTVHATHTGNFYGFLNGLVMEDGTQITKVAPDVYKLTVPNEGVSRIRVMVSAEETPHYSPLTEIVGTATPLGLNLGNVTLTGVSNTAQPIDLSKAKMTLTSLLLEGSVERVTNLKGPVTLTRKSGATSTCATFTSSGSGKPTIVVTVTTLPLIGQTVQITVTGASVQQPASCPLFFGTTNLQTEFTLTDGTTPPLAIRGTDQWTCVPFQLINL